MKSMANLHLAPPEERLLKRILSPDPPSRIKSFFQRPVRDASGAMVTILILSGIALAVVLLLGIMLLPRADAAIGDLLGDSTRTLLGFLIIVALYIAVLIGNIIRYNRMLLLERVVRKLYNALEEEGG